MTKKLFTKAEFRTFDYLTHQASSQNQLDRITGRMALGRFTALHGQAKCDAMWAEIEQQLKDKRNDGNGQGTTRSNRKGRRAAGKGR